MRNKETAADYRYFPDPNIMPIVIDDAWLEAIRASMPATAEEMGQKYVEMGIGVKEAAVLASDAKLCEFFEKVISLGAAPKSAAAWILTECMNQMSRIGATSLDIAPEKLARIITLVDTAEITRAAGKKVLVAVFAEDVDVDKYCDENGLNVKVDDSLITDTVARIINENPQAVADYKGGKVKAMQALFGLIMRELKGTGDPTVIRKILEEKLNG